MPRAANFSSGLQVLTHSSCAVDLKGDPTNVVGAPRFEEWNQCLSNTRIVMRREPSFLKIEVKRIAAEDSFETSLHCSRNHCGEIVNIDSDGSTTIHSVSCPNHGFLTSFPDQIALREFVRCSANKILAATGHKLIEEGATSTFGSYESPHKVVN